MHENIYTSLEEIFLCGDHWNFFFFFVDLDNADVKRTTMRELRVLKMLKQENIVQLK